MPEENPPFNAMNFATYAQDLEQDPFDPIDFVERLAWRMTGGEEDIDPMSLHQSFEEEIYNLQILSDQYQSKILHLQNQCREDEEEFAVTLDRLTEENKQSEEKLKFLDEKIGSVARKVVHLGEQLSQVNEPRSRANDTLSLIKHFNEFLAEQPLESPIFTDPDRLLESADIIHKLHLVSQELTGEKYANVQTRIQYKHEEIEKSLCEDFARVYRTGNKAKMKAIAHVLSNFSAYSECVNIYIETIQIGAFRSMDIFEDIYHVCEKSASSTHEIFPAPEQVTSKLVLNLFHGRLQEHITKRIGDTADNEEWLRGLHDLYLGTRRLCDRLLANAQLSFGGVANSEFLDTLVASLFNKYLSVYMVRESRYLQSYCAQQLARFYDGKGHQKRQMQAGGISDLKRDIQARVFTPESYGGETFISEEVVVNLLQETRGALERAKLLSDKKDQSKNATQIIEYLFTNLCQEHLEYAVELARHSIPLSDQKSPPESHFFSVVRQCATMSPLIDRLYDDVVVALVINTPEHEVCIRKKREVMFSLENKMSDGLDRQLRSICSYIRFVLTNEAKMRPDYYTSGHQPDAGQTDHLLQPPSTSPAALTVSRFLSKQADRIRDSLDGGNLTSTLTELGVRVHRVVLDHIYTCQFSMNGALLLLHDVRELSECVRHWHIGLVKSLFELLASLANLLAVSPNNVGDIAQADRLKDIEPSVIVSFVQLRTDYKSAKLYNEFR